jgi:hypothetical protein
MARFRPATEAELTAPPEIIGLSDIELEAWLTSARQRRGYVGIAAFVVGLLAVVFAVSGGYLAFRQDDPGDISDANVIGLLLIMAAWPTSIVGTCLSLCGLNPIRSRRRLAALGVALNAPLALLPCLLVLVAVGAGFLQHIGIL